MALHRQSGGGNGPRDSIADDYVSIGIRGGSRHFPHRLSKPPPAYGISFGLCFLTLSLVLSLTALFYFILQTKGIENSRHQSKDYDANINSDFLMNLTRIEAFKDLQLGSGSSAHSQDSRDWDKDDRRRDEEYKEEAVRKATDENINNNSLSDESHSVSDHQENDLYNEARQNELKMYEAMYEASLKNIKGSKDVNNQQYGDADEYDDGMDIRTDVVEELDDAGPEGKDGATSTIPHTIDTWESSHVNRVEDEKQNGVEDEKLDGVEDEKQDGVEETDNASSDSNTEETLSEPQISRVIAEGQAARRLIPQRNSGSNKKPKHRKVSGPCTMKLLNCTSMIVEPLESKKFARFSLQYLEKEDRPIDNDNWEPRFAGHQSFREREDSFIARDQTIKCGFVNGPDGSRSTGFDLDEDDAKYISSCHIAVSSCIFGNSDRLRSPMGKTVSRLSKKNVCFVMFMDEVTLQTLSLEGQKPDAMGIIGLWKVVVVKNLSCSDMRRVGKIPKLLPHRIFPSARLRVRYIQSLRPPLFVGRGCSKQEAQQVQP